MMVGFTMADIFTQAHSHSIDRVRGGPAHKLGSRAVSGEADQDKVREAIWHRLQLNLSPAHPTRVRTPTLPITYHPSPPTAHHPPPTTHHPQSIALHNLSTHPIACRELGSSRSPGIVMVPAQRTTRSSRVDAAQVSGQGNILLQLPPTSKRLLQYRLSKFSPQPPFTVLNHECGHLLGIKHCVYARCLMNGSSSLREAESRPLALCPIDLAKYCDTLTRAALMPSTEGLAQESRDQAAFLAARESALLSFFKGAGAAFAEDAKRSEKLLALLKSDKAGAGEGEGNVEGGREEGGFGGTRQARSKRKEPLGATVAPVFRTTAMPLGVATTTMAAMTMTLAATAVSEAEGGTKWAGGGDAKGELGTSTSTSDPQSPPRPSSPGKRNRDLTYLGRLSKPKFLERRDGVEVEVWSQAEPQAKAKAEAGTEPERRQEGAGGEGEGESVGGTRQTRCRRKDRPPLDATVAPTFLATAVEPAAAATANTHAVAAPAAVVKAAATTGKGKTSQPGGGGGRDRGRRRDLRDLTQGRHSRPTFLVT